MPNYKGHIAGGVGSFCITLAVVTQYCCPSALTVLEWLGFSIAGALFPDVDIKSKGQRYGYWLIVLLLVTLLLRKRFEMLMSVSIIAMLPMLAKHRGLFHRTWFVIALPLGLWYLVAREFPAISQELLFDALFFITGAISHLWLDLGIRRMLRL